MSETIHPQITTELPKLAFDWKNQGVPWNIQSARDWNKWAQKVYDRKDPQYGPENIAERVFTLSTIVELASKEQSPEATAGLVISELLLGVYTAANKLLNFGVDISKIKECGKKAGQLLAK